MAETSNSPLAYLGFQAIPPNPLLQPFVQSYWYFQRALAPHEQHDEYMHPRGGFGIAFNFGDPQQLDGENIQAPVFLDGSNTISRQMRFRGNVEMMGIRFHEGGAYPFIGIPLHELRNQAHILDALSKPGLLQLHASLLEAKSLLLRINVLETWLMNQLLSGKERHSIIPATLAALRRAPKDFPIPELARNFAISQRQLERLYQSQVGMSPKQYFQLVRVESARLALRKPETSSLASLAAELGFFDQAHFIREFSAVIGITPYAYLQYSQRKSKK